MICYVKLILVFVFFVYVYVSGDVEFLVEMDCVLGV
jgi:hypothetical protein